MTVTRRLSCLFAVSVILLPASAAPNTPPTQKRGADVSRQGTAQMMLVPVGGNGNEITIEPGGRVVIEVFVADIAPTLLRGFQIQLPLTAGGGAVGSVDFLPIPGESPRINQFRFDDWVFPFISEVTFAFSLDPLRLAAALNDPKESVAVTEAKYIGEVIFEASEDARGDFTIDLVLDSNNTQLADPGALLIPFTAINAIIHIPCSVNADCDDGLFCTGVETCSGGVCQPGSDPCTDPGFPFCDEVDNECDECVVDQDCDDSDFCNGAETCLDGVCQTAADLDAGTPCGDASDTACTDPDTCDGAGTCQDNHTDGAVCDDGLFCNENETCTGGVCGGGSFTCDDDNTCTIDTCDEQQQVCSNDVDPISCLIEGACVANGVLNPLNSCEVCDSAQSPDTWTVLPDGSACEDDTIICTADVCAAGACTHDNLTEGTECDVDGEPCNGVDTCDGMGICLPGSITDCNENGVEDTCDLDDGTSLDCNENQIPDECDIAQGASDDCNENGIPDECEPDCNENFVADECDITNATSSDCNKNGIPDECEPDCNENFVADECDITNATSLDCNNNQVPDECDIADQTSPDCNANGTPDECDLADCPKEDLSCGDCQPNGIPDGCDIADGTSLDVNPTNGLPDECEACESNLACDDGNPCTFDICVDEVCENIEALYGDVHGPGGTCGPDGNVSLVDILGLLDGFRGIFSEGCEKVNIDISGLQGNCEPNEIIDLADILAVLDAFMGFDACCSGG